jgi:hypothetical protein
MAPSTKKERELHPFSFRLSRGLACGDVGKGVVLFTIHFLPSKNSEERHAKTRHAFVIALVVAGLESYLAVQNTGQALRTSFLTTQDDTSSSGFPDSEYCR